MIWGKMLRLLSVKMNKEALEILKAFEIKMKSKGETVQVYTKPVELFIAHHLWKDYNGGAVVIGFEDDNPHSCLKIGDIAVKVHGEEFENVSGMSALRKKFGKTVPVTILRMTARGNLEILVVNYKDGDPRVAFLDLMEDNVK
jgi:C-terminal processing protease CtpA/Prc